MNLFRPASTLVLFAAMGLQAAENDPLEFPPAKSPAESLAAIKLSPGLDVELVAAEPLVIDPVAVDWGADGTLWVVEMCDYPMGMDGHWKPGSRIKCLRSSKHDGKYDQATVFLDNLPFATGVTAWRKGALICAAPDIIYAEDTDGDGRADVVKKLFTGFETGNYQARVNSLSLGLDNWVYGANGLLGGIIRGQALGILTSSNGGEPNPIEVDIRGRDFRIHPDTGAFEPESGLTQQGRSRDDWGDWFGCDNSTAGWNYPIADRYLRRNPYVPTPSPRVVIAGPDLLYPASHALERFNNPGSLNHVTSGCGICVYRDHLLGEDFYGNAFVCEPVHNLVHRMVLKPNGVTFSTARAKEEQQSEFFASRDNWSRPVQARTGPDGALWVVDMYRFVIEHPRWIPPERLAKLDVRAGADKGRIYRVFKKGQKFRGVPDLTKLPTAKLAQMLDTPNGTERDRIHQELVFNSRNQKADRKTIDVLKKLAQQSKEPAVRLQALCVLDGLRALEPKMVERALADSNPHVRANAVRLAEQYAGGGARTFLSAAGSGAATHLEAQLLKLAGDPSLIVRYQLALSLGEWNTPEAGEALGKILAADNKEEWVRAAVLSSAVHKTPALLKVVASLPVENSDRSGAISELIATGAGEADAASLKGLMDFVAPAGEKQIQEWQLASLASMLDALERKKITLVDLRASNPPESKRVDSILEQAPVLAKSASTPTSERDAAIRLLGRRPEQARSDLDVLVQLLDPAVPIQFQKTALQVMKRNRSAEIAKRLLTHWAQLSFAIRPTALSVLLTRDDWTAQLLNAVDAGSVGRNEIPLANRQILFKSSNKDVRDLAAKIWSAGSSDRAEVIKRYQVALTLTGDPLKGRGVWSKNCVICHYFRGEGAGVGPNLGALTDKTPADFLNSILDPNAVVEPRFVAYNLDLKDGRSLTGTINTETATTLTLAQPGGTYEKILRGDISEIRASKLSLMPEGLEQNITPQDMANLIAYLNNAPHPLGSATPEQASAAKKKFLASSSSIVEVSGDKQTHKSWMGELPIAMCAPSQGQAKLSWKSVPIAADADAKGASEFRVSVSMGHHGKPPGQFALLVNGKRMIDFGIALHDGSWQSTDGKAQMSYFVMEDSSEESNGILTISLQNQIAANGASVNFEVDAVTPGAKGWFGVYLVEPGQSQAAR